MRGGGALEGLKLKRLIADPNYEIAILMTMHYIIISRKCDINNLIEKKIEDEGRIRSYKH